MTEMNTMPGNELDVRINLFGVMEVQNLWGSVEENRSRQNVTWLLLKYLLLDPAREVPFQELLAHVWPGEAEDEKAAGAARVRLRRMRDALEPLHLGGTGGLLLYHRGMYSLNPAYKLDTDADEFLRLVDRIQTMDLQDPEGLKLCTLALRLFRGPYMGDSPDTPWAAPYREYYNRRLAAMIQEILARMRAMEDLRPLHLLCRRAVDLLPEHETLHREILRYMIGNNLELALLRYVPQLHATGAAWLTKLDI